MDNTITPIQAKFKKYDVENFPNGRRYYIWLDGDDYFRHYEIIKPNGMVEDLKQCRKDLQLDKRLNPIIEFIEKSKFFINEKIYGIVGFGGLTTVFDIGDGRVLKISEENPFEFRNYNPKFDIPLLSDVKSNGKYYAYIQRAAETEGVSTANVLKVKQKMRRQGYTPSRDFSNWRTEQVGILNGRSYLLDSRCAIPMNDKRTRFADWFKKWYDRSPLIAIKVSDMDIDIPVKHVDETPKANYTKAEARKIIKNVLESWHDSYKMSERITFKFLKKFKVL
ncbi:hypothetical protein J6S88_06585 [bacterium]|nr:hypothetical protein [bacterium]